VLLPEFGAFLAAADPASAAPPAGNPHRQQLVERCRLTFAEGLISPLLAFSDSCRAALAAPGKTAGDGVQSPNSWGGNLVGLALAIPACFAIGWLAHRFLGRPADPLTAAPSTLDALRPTTTPLPTGTGQGVRPTQPVVPQRPGPPRAEASTTASLTCLRGGQAEIPAPADPSNYDTREAVNWIGQPVPNQPQLIVLHETVVDEPTALGLFQRRHANDADQASYHVLIGLDGRRIRVVDDDKRAFGAGDSAFNGLTVQLKPNVRSSVNNIALHVSLVSPPDGADGERRSHSGYTDAQYRSLAAQIALWQALYGIRSENVVTHEEVDRSGTRRDPRSLDWQALSRNLQQQLLACGAGASSTGQMRRP
jgi:N-acetyl-anhydromuramyl-L-alanine amidase AmpD